MRRSLRAACALMAAGGLLAGCTDSAAREGDAQANAEPAAQVAAPRSSTVLSGRTEMELGLEASQAVWTASPVVVTVADLNALQEATSKSRELGVPVLVVPQAGAGASGPDAEASDPELLDASESPSEPATSPSGDGGSSVVDAELERLGTTHVLHVGPGQPDVRGVEVVAMAQDLPDFEAAVPVAGLVAMTSPRATPEGSQAAVATLAAAGAESLDLKRADPRVKPADVRAVAAAAPEVAIGIGRRFGGSDVFSQRVQAAATGVQLPGGGQTIFHDKRYVALYGHPLTGGLGVLGEQGPAATVDRARSVAAQYEGLTGETIVPAFEIIATVAAGSAGEDRDWSREWAIEDLRPLVDVAAEAGIYVVLDLQSGRADFLSQAQEYEELLVEPHVGLALDPEWRLKKGEKPLQQIGSVSAAEVNETMDWLAELTDRNDLPQKMLLLHQFRTDMITDRQDLDLSHDELAVIVQMDGDGTLGQKLDTWGALRVDAPAGLKFGWKNFYDEDEPTPSPATTFRVDPTPWWVSYQ
ncbi:MAG: hypothetical protein OEU98_06240 [Actinomycetota bacterium]|nr:hypothetical protein [Actinomycetota bacterium]